MTNLSQEQWAKMAIRTESVVPDLNRQEAQLIQALELVAIAGEILDQVKRKIFYGEEGEYKPEKLNAAADRLAQIDAFSFTADEFVNQIEAPALVDPNTRVVHGIVGNITEAAEQGEALLEYLRTGKFDVVNLMEEKADVDWYQAILADALHFNTTSAYQFLVAKLSARYGDKFSDVSAVVRNLGSEREVMERFLQAYNESL